MSFKLVYFDARARGELSRLLFAAGGVKYEDKRIKFEDWPKVKPTTPLGSLPYLEVEGEMIPQSMTIVRYLARTFKLMGKTDLDEAKINVVLDTVNDFKTELYTAHFEKDEAKKAELTKKLHEETLKKVLTYLEEMVKKNKSGFIVGESMSAADLIIYDGFESTLKAKPDVLDKFPGIKSLREKVAKLPRIATYLKERPESSM